MMSGLFVILFLAALVGVFRPYLGLQRKVFVITAVVSFIAVGIVAPKHPDEPKTAQGDNATPGSSTISREGQSADTQNSTASPTSQGKWDYSNDKDEMRGTTAHFAMLASENQVDLDFPYGEVSGHLTIRKRPTDGLKVLFSVDKGQILCSNFTSSHIAVKFDDQPIKDFECSGTSDGSSETAFFEAGSKMLAKLKKAKRTIIEAEFYQKGRQQFTFDTAGLKWAD